MKWYGDIILKAVEKRKDAFLHAAGQHAQNQMVQFAHIIEGVLKNSINYKIYNGDWSGFGSITAITPPDDAKMETPKKDYVRIGSNLIYAGAQEKHNGWGSRSIDTIEADGTLQQIADRAFKL